MVRIDKNKVELTGVSIMVQAELTEGLVEYIRVVAEAQQKDINIIAAQTLQSVTSCVLKMINEGKDLNER